MATQQVKEGAHVLDVCVDYVGRDGTADMDEVAKRFATQANAPLVLDSTEPEVIEAGLQWVGGRAIVNSANLEDGYAEGSRLDRVFKLAKEYGAAVICLCIDEEGQARDVEWKVRVAHRQALSLVAGGCKNQERSQAFAAIQHGIAHGFTQTLRCSGRNPV